MSWIHVTEPDPVLNTVGMRMSKRKAMKTPSEDSGLKSASRMSLTQPMIPRPLSQQMANEEIHTWHWVMKSAPRLQVTTTAHQIISMCTYSTCRSRQRHRQAILFATLPLPPSPFNVAHFHTPPKAALPAFTVDSIKFKLDVADDDQLISDDEDHMDVKVAT